MIKFLLIFMLIFSPVVFGAMYAIEKPDGSVVITTYVEGSQDTLEDVVRELGLLGRPIIAITRAELPPMEDSDYWRFNPVPIGDRLIVDQVAKQADLDAEAIKEADRLKTLQKMGISKDEFKQLKEYLKG